MFEDGKIIPFPRRRSPARRHARGWAGLGPLAEGLASSYARRRASACATEGRTGPSGEDVPSSPPLRALEPDEGAALRVLARWSDDPEALGRLTRLDDAAGLGICGDVEAAVGLRVATRALLAGRLLSRPAGRSEEEDRRRLLIRHADRDPGLVAAFRGRPAPGRPASPGPAPRAACDPVPSTGTGEDEA